MPRPLVNAFAALASLLALLILLRLTWSPDPAGSLFARANQLENAGQTALALRAYALISDQHPESFYAPRALLKQGDLLAAQGTRAGDPAVLKAAVANYARLARAYPRDVLVSEALLDGGRISLENLGDFGAAKGFYEQLLDKSSAKSDTAATATLQLGRIALREGDKLGAQTLLQRVLRLWPNLSDRGAQAQFTLGLVYETLWKKRDWAMRAYNATIDRYPNSSWANDAREKLGLIAYLDNRGKPPARRVLVQIEPLPDEGRSDGSLWSTLRPILAARGVEASDAALGGWSLAPFYAGFDPKNPARVVDFPVDGWENVLANVGLRFSVGSGGSKGVDALKQLQFELDNARPPLVYFEANGAKTWALCVGYDSERGEVMLQSRGARFDTLSAPVFAKYWAAKSSFGQGYTLISLVPRDQKSATKPSLTPTPAALPVASPQPGASLPGEGLVAPPGARNAPQWVWELPKISPQSADNRARLRAATILSRPKSGDVLMGAAGLENLASELNRIAKARPLAPEIAPAPTLEPTPEPTLEPVATPEITPEAESPYAPDATATPLPTLAPRLELRRTVLRDDDARAVQLLGFFGAAAQHWASQRREAAAWCQEAARRSKNPAWEQAGDALKASAEALESAVSLAPATVTTPLGAGDRAQIGEAARQIERAARAERAAARALGS